MSSGSKKRKEATKRSNQHAEFMQKVPKLWSFFGNDAKQGDGSTETIGNSRYVAHSFEF